MPGNGADMATDVEIDRVLNAVSATLNDQGMREYNRSRVQELVTAALGGEPDIVVDDGGGLHDSSGSRIGAIRRTDSGEWIVDRQNPAAPRSDTEVPAPPRKSVMRGILSRLKSRAG